MLYRLARPVLFRFEAERVHELAVRRLEAAGRSERLTRMLRARYFHEDPRLSQELWGLTFPNPVGIAAGFDKNARLVGVLPHLGFGFVEVGTVTSEAQAGNPRPRLFRLPKDQALINRLGFNNEGADLVAARLAKAPPAMVPVGVNIGKARRVPNAEATADYLKTFERLFPYGGYFVVNVSSPNTPGLRDLQARESMEELVRALRQRNAELARAQGARPRPLLVKISPDILPKDLEGFVQVALAERATRMVRTIHEQTEGRIPIVGVGGVFSAEDAWEKIRAGASLVQ
ncbi:MAG TPA: quinone-dependent dihydroorotate dehydrogenase, partial [Candidatus Thermoplasmatota archaeon]|nr:quinone-dependent dihydroorotate dehydrogenase [Candidatus Thermoplasmatota archaeon]